MAKTLKDVKEILADCKFPGRWFTVTSHGYDFLLQVCFTGHAGEERYGRKWHICETSTDREIVEIAFSALRASQEYDAQTLFTYNGLRIVRDLDIRPPIKMATIARYAQPGDRFPIPDPPSQEEIKARMEETFPTGLAYLNDSVRDWNRIDNALQSDNPAGALNRAMKSSSTMRESFPEIAAIQGFGGGETGMKDLWAHTVQVVAQTPADPPYLRIAALFHDLGKPKCFTRDGGKIAFHHHEAESGRIWDRVCRRVGPRIDAETQERVHFLVTNLGFVEAYDSTWTDSAVRRLLKDVEGLPNLRELVTLSKADITTKHANLRLKHELNGEELYTRAEDLHKIDSTPPALPSGLGDAIKEVFALNGKDLGRAMQQLRDEVEAGRLPRNDPNFEAYLRGLVKMRYQRVWKLPESTKK